MAKHKYEFKPDPAGSGLMNKLYLTPQQRSRIKQWALYTVLFVLSLAVQDAVLGRYRILGGVIDLAPCFIMLVYVVQGAENGCVFALSTALFYYFSGSAPGMYVVLLITVIGAVISVLQESFLQPGFGADWFCAGLAMVIYEMSVFCVGLISGQTYGGRFGAFFVTAVLCVAVIPALYPPVKKIGEIGGTTWSE